MDFRMLNGWKNVTVIENFRGLAKVVAPKMRQEFPNLESAKKHMEEHQLQPNITHLFGPSIAREILNVFNGK